MSADFSWIQPHPHGIYVAPADCWVDPSRAVDHALVTHGHADHARGGHGATVATPETLAIMKLRYATDDGATPVSYGETIALSGGVSATYLPAGHVLGSAQILLEHAGERVIVTGDYKRRPDPTCPEYTVTPCDVLITEATFGLAVIYPPTDRRGNCQNNRRLGGTPRSLRARRGLCFGQGSAGNRRAPRSRPHGSNLPSRRYGENVSPL